MVPPDKFLTLRKLVVIGKERMFPDGPISGQLGIGPIRTPRPIRRSACMRRYMNTFPTGMLPLLATVAGIICLGGCCQTKTMQYVTVTIQQMSYEAGEPPSPTRTLRTADPAVVNKLASFFPGLGTGRGGLSAVSLAPTMYYSFTDSRGMTIKAYTIGYDRWGSDIDRGDLAVRGDLRRYLAVLFARTRTESSTSSSSATRESQ